MYQLCPTLGKVMQSVQTKRAPKKLKGYLTTNEAAKLIGVSPKTLRRWDNAGKLKAVRHPMNRYRLYKASDLIKQFSLGEPDGIYKVYTVQHTEAPLRDFASISPTTPLQSLNLNWRETGLPERERTKHVHRLHPYLGKFIPQLVEVFLRKFSPTSVCDPFSGSGTTVVEANTLGIDSVGCDISQFNCLIAKVKTDRYDLPLLEKELKDIISKINLTIGEGLFSNGEEFETDNEYLRRWFAPGARRGLLAYRSLLKDYRYHDVMKVILCRSARSARLTTHFDLDFPKTPQREPYYCYKHDRTCQPVQSSLQFLNRYTFDTLDRIKEFSRLRTAAKVKLICGDARTVKFPHIDAVMTSPPYVGLIDYHEQHRYAYELLGLPMQAQSEIGAAFKGNSEKARKDYIDGVAQVFANLRSYLQKDGVVVVVVNDKYGLYETLPQKVGYTFDQTITRHVNRRTGRRSTDFFEEILIWRPA